MISLLFEDMTFDQLFRVSEPKRVKRSATVRGPPLEINGNSDAVYHVFNFKSFPSTTGLRHHGYIKFKRPRRGNARLPLQHIPCEVDCTCPDFRYRWAWADKQRGAAKVGPQSMNQSLNRAPRITNPTNVPGLCKHILAARDYIYGMLAKFPGNEPDTGEKLAQLVGYANKRWANFDTLMSKAKDQEKWFAAVKQAMNQGRGGDMDLIYDLYQAKGGKFLGIPAGVPPRGALREPPPEDVPPLPPQRPGPPEGGAPALPAAGRPTLRPGGGAALAIPPGQRGRGVPQAPAKPEQVPLAIPPGQRGRQLPVRNNLPIGRKTGKPTGADNPPGKRGQVPKSPRREGLDNFPAASVSNLNGSNDGANQIMRMNLNEAKTLIEELEHEEVAAPSDIAGDMDMADAPPPSEPPVSDEAVGADTEGNVVLQLLSDIKDLLAQLVGGGSDDGMPGEGELDMPPEGGEGALELPPEGGEEGGEEGAAVDAIPEPPTEDEEDEERRKEEDGRPPHHDVEGGE